MPRTLSLVVVGGGWWWLWLRPILVFSLSLDQAEQLVQEYLVRDNILSQLIQDLRLCIC